MSDYQSYSWNLVHARSSFELAGKYLGADVINITQVVPLWVRVKASAMHY